MCLNFGCGNLGQDVPITLFDPDVQKLTVTVNGVSAAMQRFKMDDENNEFYTLFRYRPVKGLGPEPGVGRRDPSNIIKAGDLYYVWYTRVSGANIRKRRWDLADLWYATSPDGINWTEQGCAVSRGEEGTYDNRSVFTCNILVHDNKYYLCYQTLPDMEHKPGVVDAVGLSIADSPDGPWKKLKKPILRTGPNNPPIPKEILESGDWSAGDKYISWDSQCVHDPQILKRDGKFWLYYKGHPAQGCMLGGHGWQAKWGVAISDNPEGPYVKHELNPITSSGHEVWVWPYKSGVAAMADWCGPEKNTIQYAEDGLNFEMVSYLNDIPPAGGAYIPDLFDDNKDGMGFKWGVCHYSDARYPDFLVRFDCDLMRNEEKSFAGAYNTYAKAMPVALRIDDYIPIDIKKRLDEERTNE